MLQRIDIVSEAYRTVPQRQSRLEGKASRLIGIPNETKSNETPALFEAADIPKTHAF